MKGKEREGETTGRKGRKGEKEEGKMGGKGGGPRKVGTYLT